MGKIRVTTLGSEKSEKEQLKQAEKRRSIKKEKKLTKLKGKGGGRIADLSQDDILVKTDQESTEKKVIKKSKKAKVRGKKINEMVKLVNKNKIYPLDEAIKLVKQTSYTKFISSVETHINVKEKGLRGTVSLPYGTGKEIKVAIADDQIVEKIQQGKIDFDILISPPQMMPKLAKLARILGPKGLMPNPKAGTISNEPEKLAKKLSGGQIQWKTETDAPIIHSIIGKVNFENKQLEDNLQTLIKSINPAKIESVFIKASMGPSIKVEITRS